MDDIWDDIAGKASSTFSPVRFGGRGWEDESIKKGRRMREMRPLLSAPLDLRVVGGRMSL